MRIHVVRFGCALVVAASRVTFVSPPVCLAELAVRVREGLYAWQALPTAEKLKDGVAIEDTVRLSKSFA